MSSPTEDTVHALLDYLVDPLLPLISKSSQYQSVLQDPSLQECIAKQMHAVVLLYNYYHRKQNPRLEFLDFVSFCKVAVNAKPNLIAFFNCMQQPNPERNLKKNNMLSLTEKGIMNACSVSLALHSLKDAAGLQAWPVCRIAVFLVDGRKENCALQYSAITRGVWSLIEIDDDNSHIVSRGSTNWPVKAGNANDKRLQKLALSVVQEETGVDPREISILESHVAYSLCEEKTATRLFIMKCYTVDAEVFQVPIKDAIDSLQGPLVKKSCNSYAAADIVEYYHLLPYAGMITDWFSREILGKERNTIKKFSSENDASTNVVALGNREGSPLTCQNADFAVSNMNIDENSDQKENGDHHVRSRKSITETEFCPINEERAATSETLDDDVLTKLPRKYDLRYTRKGSITKEEMLPPVTEASTTVGNIADAEASRYVGANTVFPVFASEQVLLMSGNELVDCVDASTPCETQKSAGSSVREKRMLDVVDGEGGEDMLKELVIIQFPTDDNSDMPLGSYHKLLLTDAILKVFDDDQATSMIRKVQICKKWAEASEIRVEILNRRSDLLGRTRKRQQLHNSSDALTICSSNIGGGKDVMISDGAEKLGQLFRINGDITGPVAAYCLDPPMDSSLDVTRGSSFQPDPLVLNGVGMQKNDLHGHHLDICMDGNAENTCGVGTSLVNDHKGVLDMLEEKVENQGLVIPQSTPENIVHVGSIYFPRRYLKLYERIVARFGDIIMPESKEARLCSDIVSATVKGLLEVVDSMLQVSPRTVDTVMLEAWELKLRFFECAGLKVGWLRDHFVKLQQVYSFSGDAPVQELEGREVVLAELLDTKPKKAADLCPEFVGAGK